MEDRLATHISDQDQIDETAFCVGCGEIVRLHDRDAYEGHPCGVICKDCVKGQTVADWFNEQVANGGDPLEAARDADACCMSFEDWQAHWMLKDFDRAETEWELDNF